MVSRPARDLVFVGDVHLDRDDVHLDDFVRFLHGLESTADRVVLMGDLFNLWIGQPALEQPHQKAVVDALCTLRRRGTVVRYVEGNRDYRIGGAYAGTAFDDVAPAGLEESAGGRRLWAIHGDLANREDVAYRRWRGVSRSTPFWRLFRMLPRRWRLSLALGLERRMRRSNLAFKGAFPEKVVSDYAAEWLGKGYDTVVLGHFHVEKELATDAGRIFVLPEWRVSRRHLRVAVDGGIGFVDST